METIVANTAVARVTLSPVVRDPYDPTQLILYHTSVSLIERLVFTFRNSSEETVMM